MERPFVAAVASLVAFAGCGGGSFDWPARPDPASCAAGWAPTRPERTDPLLGPGVMLWADGVLYQSVSGAATDPYRSALIADPLDGSAPLLLAEDWAQTLFVDGESLLFSHDDRLMRVPRSGGTPEVVLDDPTVEHLYVQAHLANDTHFYWATAGTNSTLWRMPRMGGPAESLGPLEVGIMAHFALVSDGVLAAGLRASTAGYDAVVVPFDGGPFRRLAPVDDLLSADASGVLWSYLVHYERKSGGRQARQLWRSPADGGEAAQLSPELPLELRADWAAPDGRGGYVISGREYFEDAILRRSVFTVAADGRATRIACDPAANGPGIESAAVAPDAVYLSVNYFPAGGWTIVRVTLP